MPRVSLCLLAVALATAGCRSIAGGPPSVEPTAGEYEQRIGPGDQIQLTVWREPDFTGEFPVDERGRVVLPRVGSYDVREHTADSLEELVRRDFAVYLQNPSIDITILRRVKVTGQVHEPGLYMVDATMSLGDALALAGGVTEEGRRNKVELIRNGSRFRADLDEGTMITSLPLVSGDELYVPQRNWFIRNYGLVASAATTLVFLMTQISNVLGSE